MLNLIYPAARSILFRIDADLLIVAIEEYRTKHGHLPPRDDYEVLKNWDSKATEHLIAITTSVNKTSTTTSPS
ncbi:MAG: hypothetical protein ACJAQT_001289 [Akkermansiaceae bacterium]|jgi:hypothetical protein